MLSPWEGLVSPNWSLMVRISVELEPRSVEKPTMKSWVLRNQGMIMIHSFPFSRSNSKLNLYSHCVGVACLNKSSWMTGLMAENTRIRTGVAVVRNELVFQPI
ncbi:hypothetical protein A2U01_0037672, partial [Trifolium medium]|nr:hypothetical protein [Trifolium medium]